MPEPSANAPCFYSLVTPAGVALISADRTPWPEHLAVSDELPRLADPEYVSGGDGMLRFSPDGGPSALYGYAHGDEFRGIAHYDLIRVDA